MKSKDSSRKWMWMFLAGVVMVQMYVVWELLAVFALFAVVFGALASVVGGLYLVHRSWVSAVHTLAESQHPVLAGIRHGLYTVEDTARRPFRRPGSATAR